MEQRITPEEREIMRHAYVFLETHCDPPANQEEGACDWWIQAAQEMAQVCSAWNNHPLAMAVLIAIYDYVGEKAKKKTEEAENV